MTESYISRKALAPDECIVQWPAQLGALCTILSPVHNNQSQCKCRLSYFGRMVWVGMPLACDLSWDAVTSSLLLKISACAGCSTSPSRAMPPNSWEIAPSQSSPVLNVTVNTFTACFLPGLSSPFGFLAGGFIGEVCILPTVVQTLRTQTWGNAVSLTNPIRYEMQRNSLMSSIWTKTHLILIIHIIWSLPYRRQNPHSYISQR